MRATTDGSATPNHSWRPGLVIFDCDGVLIDSEPIACRVTARLLAAHSCQVPADEIIAEFTGISPETLRARMEQRFGRTLPDDFGAVLSAAITEAFEGELRAVAGADDMLQELILPCCVASSSDLSKLRAGLHIAELDRHFGEAVFSASMVARGKPAPDLFLHAAREMRCDPRRAVVVEDSVPGVTAGKRAGMTVIGFTAGSHCGLEQADRLVAAGADNVVDGFAALSSMLHAWCATREE